MNHLTSISHLNQTIDFWHSVGINDKQLLSLILRNYSQLLDQDFIVPGAVYEKLDKAEVIWATDHANKVLGGICYHLDSSMQIANILLNFSTTEFDLEMHKTCHAQFELKSKEKHIVTLVYTVHSNNETEMSRAKELGMKPTYCYLSQTLLKDI